MICQHFKNLSSDKIFSSRQCYSHRYENYFYFIFIWWNLVLRSQQCLPLSLALLSTKPKLLNRKKTIFNERRGLLTDSCSVRLMFLQVRGKPKMEPSQGLWPKTSSHLKQVFELVRAPLHRKLWPKNSFKTHSKPKLKFLGVRFHLIDFSSNDFL